MQWNPTRQHLCWIPAATIQAHSESPRTPQAVCISRSLPKHSASPSYLSPNTPLGNPRSVCSRSLPGWSVTFCHFSFFIQLHTHTLLGHFPYSLIYLPRTLPYKICVSVLRPWSCRFFMGSKRHTSHILHSFCFFLISSGSSKYKMFEHFKEKLLNLINKTIYFPLASFSEKLETLRCKDSAGDRNWHGKIHHKQLESGWLISNWKKICIKEHAWKSQ